MSFQCRMEEINTEEVKFEFKFVYYIGMLFYELLKNPFKALIPDYFNHLDLTKVR